MADYKELYLTMVREAEKAINILINAQKKCEEMYINMEEPGIILMSKAQVESSSQNTPLK